MHDTVARSVRFKGLIDNFPAFEGIGIRGILIRKTPAQGHDVFISDDSWAVSKIPVAVT